MYRGRCRNCPACGRPMQRRDVEAGAGEGCEVDLCVHCGGVFIEFFDGEPASVALGVEELAVSQPAAKGRDWPSSARCPDCGVAMRAMRYMDEEDGPPVFRCDTCMALFVGHGQVRRLAQYAATLFAPVDET